MMTASSTPKGTSPSAALRPFRGAGETGRSRPRPPPRRPPRKPSPRRSPGDVCGDRVSLAVRSSGARHSPTRFEECPQRGQNRADRCAAGGSRCRAGSVGGGRRSRPAIGAGRRQRTSAPTPPRGPRNSPAPRSPVSAGSRRCSTMHSCSWATSRRAGTASASCRSLSTNSALRRRSVGISSRMRRPRKVPSRKPCRRSRWAHCITSFGPGSARRGSPARRRRPGRRGSTAIARPAPRPPRSARPRRTCSAGAS